MIGLLLGSISCEPPSCQAPISLMYLFFEPFEFPSSDDKSLPAVQETQFLSLGREDPLEKEMVTHSSFLAWRIPWIEEPGGLHSMGSQRVGRDWAISLNHSLVKQVH